MQRMGDNQGPAKCTARRLLMVVPRLAAVRQWARCLCLEGQREGWNASVDRQDGRVKIVDAKRDLISLLVPDLPTVRACHFPVFILGKSILETADFCGKRGSTKLLSAGEIHLFPVNSRRAGKFM